MKNELRLDHAFPGPVEHADPLIKRFDYDEIIQVAPSLNIPKLSDNLASRIYSREAEAIIETELAVVSWTQVPGVSNVNVAHDAL